VIRLWANLGQEIAGLPEGHLRHTMAHRFLESSGNDLVSLAQILGHESLNTTARYTRRTETQLAEAAEKVGW